MLLPQPWTSYLVWCLKSSFTAFPHHLLYLCLLILCGPASAPLFLLNAVSEVNSLLPRHRFFPWCLFSLVLTHSPLPTVLAGRDAAHEWPFYCGKFQHMQQQGVQSNEPMYPSPSFDNYQHSHCLLSACFKPKSQTLSLSAALTNENVFF